MPRPLSVLAGSGLIALAVGVAKAEPPATSDSDITVIAPNSSFDRYGPNWSAQEAFHRQELERLAAGQGVRLSEKPPPPSTVLRDSSSGPPQDRPSSLLTQMRAFRDAVPTLKTP